MRNVPNILSLVRLLFTIPLVILILVNMPAAYLWATALFLIGAITDTLDGRIARRYKVVSNLGVFLDLTADKVYVAAALVAYTQVGVAPAWIAIIIITREFMVSGLRSLAASQGVVIPAGRLGKQKTFFTLVAIGGILLSRGLGGRTAFPLGLSTSAAAPQSIPDFMLAISDALLLLAVIWTILSAVEYIRGAWELLMSSQPSQRARDQ